MAEDGVGDARQGDLGQVAGDQHRHAQELQHRIQGHQARPDAEAGGEHRIGPVHGEPLGERRLQRHPEPLEVLAGHGPRQPPRPAEEVAVAPHGPQEIDVEHHRLAGHQQVEAEIVAGNEQPGQGHIGQDAPEEGDRLELHGPPGRHHGHLQFGVPDVAEGGAEQQRRHGHVGPWICGADQRRDQERGEEQDRLTDLEGRGGLRGTVRARGPDLALAQQHEIGPRHGLVDRQQVQAGGLDGHRLGEDPVVHHPGDDQDLHQGIDDGQAGVGRMDACEAGREGPDAADKALALRFAHRRGARSCWMKSCSVRPRSAQS